MADIGQLKANLEQKEAELRSEQQRGAVADQGKITILQQEYLDIQAQINHAEVEGITQAVAASTESFTVDGTTYTLDELAADSDAAIILRQGLRQVKTEVQERASGWVNDLQTQKSDYEQKLAEKDEQIRAYQSQIDALQQDNGRLTLERDDALEKRDAAVRQAEELQSENARLNSHLDDLRTQIAVGASAAVNVIDINSDDELKAAAERLKARKAAAEQAAKEAAEAAKIRIYDVQPGDTGTTFYKAKRADNDEAIEIRPYFAINQYVVLTDPEELARFREANKPAEEDPVVESNPADEATSEPLAPPEIPFRNDEATDAQPTDGLEGNETDEAVVGKTVEERLASVEARLDRLEGKQLAA